MRARLDGNGVPIMSREDIERRAERLLQHFDEECLRTPKAATVHGHYLPAHRKSTVTSFAATVTLRLSGCPPNVASTR
jgi:hypothetical protein